ncbi:hypothetical protein [Glaciimonas sp. PAMC28666]|uniref:hypothetical protein n=1 Tax=Glaciimonas sp. PAMC28666 TaxID=2807626 RepID=UPI001963DD9E|nr:hypothetical protein [Glaciimonas sp. PAMC28666]QRX83596.1 hypothetical protein JQN73_04995 [Glaciimonas sp. PAMC28666]
MRPVSRTVAGPGGDGALKRRTFGKHPDDYANVRDWIEEGGATRIIDGQDELHLGVVAKNELTKANENCISHQSLFYFSKA